MVKDPVTLYQIPPNPVVNLSKTILVITTSILILTDKIENTSITIRIPNVVLSLPSHLHHLHNHWQLLVFPDISLSFQECYVNRIMH